MGSFKNKYWVAGIVAGTLLCSGMAYASSGIKLKVNGQEIHSDVPPQIIDGTTLVPARYLAEALGADVQWDSVNQTVIVSRKGEAAEQAYSYKGSSFTVALPLEWKEKLVIEERDNETLFYYAPKDALQKREVLFSIDAVSQEEWAAREGAGFFTVLGNRNGVVYALHTPGENPYAVMQDSVEYKESWSMLSQLKSSIRFTFNEQQELVLTNPRQAAEMYLFGLQQRNASIQYATFSESMKKQMLPEFEQLNWVTGVSSPWISKWEITKQTEAGEHKEILEVRLDTATSTGPEAPVLLTITVVKDNERWVVGEVAADRELPGSGLNGKEAADAVPAFDEKDAVSLAAQAAAGYWHISTGGGGTPEGAVQEFAIPGKGEHYRWMGEELGTKAKLIAYLEKSFTPEKVRQYWSSQEQAGAFAEVDGRLAQPNADGGSQAKWSEAAATLLEDRGASKEYLLHVPVGETETRDVRLTVRYVEKQGWRIDGNVSDIR